MRRGRSRWTRHPWLYILLVAKGVIALWSFGPDSGVPRAAPCRGDSIINGGGETTATFSKGFNINLGREPQAEPPAKPLMQILEDPPPGLLTFCSDRYAGTPG